MIVLSAIITPPDIFTQLLLAGPLVLLYEMSIIVSYMALKKGQEEEDEEDEDGDDEDEAGERDEDDTEYRGEIEENTD